jgi:hypothetical protein
LSQERRHAGRALALGKWETRFLPVALYRKKRKVPAVPDASSPYAPGGTGLTGHSDQVFENIGTAENPVWSIGSSDISSSQALEEVSKANPENIQEVGGAFLRLSTSYYQNALNQAKRSFMAAVIAASAGLALFIAAVSILLSRNNLQAGTISVIGGAIVECISGLNFWLYSRTASQMNIFHVRLEQTQKYLLANSISTKLTTENRDAALMALMEQMSSNPVPEPNLQQGALPTEKS